MRYCVIYCKQRLAGVWHRVKRQPTTYTDFLLTSLTPTSLRKQATFREVAT